MMGSVLEMDAVLLLRRLPPYSSKGGDCDEDLIFTFCYPPLQRIQSSRSTSSERFILLVIVENINLFWRRSGSGNSILRSKRPGRSRAGSKVSALFVAMITWHREGPAQTSAIPTSSFPVMTSGPHEPAPIFPQSLHHAAPCQS